MYNLRTLIFQYSYFYNRKMMQRKTLGILANNKYILET